MENAVGRKLTFGAGVATTGHTTCKKNAVPIAASLQPVSDGTHGRKKYFQEITVKSDLFSGELSGYLLSEKNTRRTIFH